MFDRALYPVRAPGRCIGAGEMAAQLGRSFDRYGDLQDEDPDRDTLVIVDRLLDRRDLHILLPFEELRINQDEGQCIFVPFGSRQSGVDAAEVAVPLAAHLGMRVIFYHTTWNKKGLASGDPSTHMCSGATSVMESLGHLAQEAGVEHGFMIELTDDVLEGVVLAALINRASLIVTSRGQSVLIGSYAERLSRGPVPVLICADQEVTL